MSASSSDSEESSIHGPLDVHVNDGWQDVESDHDLQAQLVCLFCPVASDDIASFLSHCKEEHAFDLVTVRRELELDFFGTIKLVNFVREAVLEGQPRPNISLASLQDEKYLQPVLKEDALLYSLDDICCIDGAPEGVSTSSNADTKIEELQRRLNEVTAQFDDYRREVNQSFFDRLEHVESDKGVNKYAGNTTGRDIESNALKSEDKGSGARLHDYETSYFSSYSFNGIHETMLKDAIRTDAYRDFIYDNKDLFANKVVLDIGCGTGILSMFCARAGAKQVIAVDNSSILLKAQDNIVKNGLHNKIHCIRGKIEEVTLSVPSVDVIISEWMGYALLFEQMLDSVLWARDRYLVPDGLMVPSHATLRLAPFSDADLVASHVSFWNDVYGFQMTSMLKNVYGDVLINTISSDAIIAEPCTFLSLDLHTIRKDELTFSHPFSLTLTKTDPHDTLDGFVIWFDIFFLPSRALPRPDDVAKARSKGYAAFSTGPESKETHWQQGVLFLDRKKVVGLPPLGSEVKGTVSYSRREGDGRGLQIGIAYEVAGSGRGRREQKWGL